MNPPRDKKGNDGLPPDDREVWDYVARQVKPLKKKKSGTAPRQSAAPPHRRVSKAADPGPPPASTRKAAPETKEPAPRGQGIDRRTDDRLRKGQMRPEARIDLHGMTQDAARAALTSFLRTAWADGKRCVLVITGKGRRKATDEEDWFSPRPGILRERVPGWLAEAPLAPMILRVHTAQPRDGGSGALYVLLRRQRG